jgi:four helix bundle protein
MTIPEKDRYNELLRERTLSMAVNVNTLFQSKNISQTTRPFVNQIIRSSSSVAANFRAATRARSNAEFFSKICIVTEECDETHFWLDYLKRINLVSYDEIKNNQDEVGQLVRIFNSIKKKMKDKIEANDKITKSWISAIGKKRPPGKYPRWSLQVKEENCYFWTMILRIIIPLSPSILIV